MTTTGIASASSCSRTGPWGGFWGGSRGESGGRPLERSYQKTEVFSHQTMVFWHQPRNLWCQKTLPKAGLRPSHGEVGVRWVTIFLKKSTNINKNMSTPSRVGELPWSLPSKRGRAAGIRVCKLGSLAYGLDVRTNFWHQPPDFWCFLLSTLWFWHQPWSFEVNHGLLKSKMDFWHQTSRVADPPGESRDGSWGGS